ncbi:M28 family peptidase [Pedobacter changchengzhani]|uniref:M28 family peptidase n=1 Tax=Pedobacter changchengzhani TaxID=2529274 RepID=A0A4R5MNF1_9SPHI|nr:M20/M25/M40 family metallo-hydrolase [Pedobacter changchengzhani]TDG37086.1 M28 family peptidase [Pedobacter changchengzhani]
MNILKQAITIIFIFLFSYVQAQDSIYVRNMVNKLTSPKFWGRGYTKGGMQKTAIFLSEEFKRIGVKPTQQYFSFPVNTFSGKMFVSINGITLQPGKDYIVSNESSGLKEKTSLQKIDSLTFQAGNNLKVLFKDKLTWSVATDVSNSTTILINKKTVTHTPKEIIVDIENKFISNFEASNVLGFVKGTKYPDSVLLITAHYDHLGGMGKNTYFPGANDNAAGVATLLSLAKYYAKNPPTYSIGFICFAAEEAGLLGSKYFTENRLIPLKSIKFLINLDLVGTGESGMTVVNATVYPKAFAMLKAVNEAHNYLPKINSRGKAPNSDHYFFSENGVPAFFFYTQGGISAYHDIYDRPETLPLTKYNNLFKLIVGFNQKLMN